jgi:hypothetical protein
MPAENDRAALVWAAPMANSRLLSVDLAYFRQMDAGPLTPAAYSMSKMAASLRRGFRTARAHELVGSAPCVQLLCRDAQ